MTTTISDGTTSIDIDPEWSSARIGKIIKANIGTLGGRDAVFNWGNYRAWQIPLRNVPNSDTQKINEWWETEVQLTFFFDSTTWDIRLINNVNPLTSLSIPYGDEYDGTLAVEVI